MTLFKASSPTAISSAPVDTRAAIRLSPGEDPSRPLSIHEYLYAASGSSPQSVNKPFQIIGVLEGKGRLPAEAWRQALDAVVEVHPGTRLRIVGQRKQARWSSDGTPPRLRFVTDCTWDGRSEEGAEFITALPLSLTDGPSCELIIAECGDNTRVIFRVLHAVMDGRGRLRFMHDLFRALRKETLNPTNFTSKCEDFRRKLSAHYQRSWVNPIQQRQTVNLTGTPQGDDASETWRRLSLPGPQPQILPRIAEAMAAYVHRESALPALFYVPVDLRRHVPEIISTMNYARVISVALLPGEGAAHFKAQLAGILAENQDASFNARLFAIADAVRLLPFRWIDRIVSRINKNVLRRKPPNTSSISNIGRIAATALRCQGFEPESMYTFTHQASTYCTINSLDDHCEIVVGMPRYYATEGRLDAFMQFLEQRLALPPELL